MDVSRWSEWDLGLKSASLDGPMGLGPTGTLVDLGGRRSVFAVTQMHDDESYTFVTKRPFGRLVVRRSLTQSCPHQLRHEVKFEGTGGWLRSHLLEPGFRRRLAPTMERPAALALLDSDWTRIAQ
jgi:hypothetical protein